MRDSRICIATDSSSLSRGRQWRWDPARSFLMGAACAWQFQINLISSINFVLNTLISFHVVSFIDLVFYWGALAVAAAWTPLFRKRRCLAKLVVLGREWYLLFFLWWTLGNYSFDGGYGSRAWRNPRADQRATGKQWQKKPLLKITFLFAFKVFFHFDGCFPWC